MSRSFLIYGAAFAVGGAIVGFVAGRVTAPVPGLPRTVAVAPGEPVPASGKEASPPRRLGKAEPMSSGDRQTRTESVGSRVQTSVPVVTGSALAAAAPAGAESDSGGSGGGSTSAGTGDAGGAIDFGTTLRSALSEQDRRKRYENLNALIRQLDPAQLPEALDYVKSLNLTGEDGFVMPMLIGRLAETNPTSALSYAQAIPDQQLSWRATSMALNTWARTAPTDALNWARMQPPSDMRGRLITETLDTWGRFDPRAAWNYALGGLNGTEQSNALAGIAGRLAATDPGTVLQWAAQFPEGDLRSRTYGAVAQAWARENPAAAWQWAAALQPGASRDTAIAGYSNALTPANPGGAIKAAEMITDKSIRDRTLASTYRDWARRDPASANTWLQQTTLVTPELKQHFTQGGRRH